MNLPQLDSAQFYATEFGGFADRYPGQEQQLPHWQQLLQAVDAMGGELESRHHKAERLLRENGVTYNVYQDPQGDSRPWQLDLLPMLIGQAEWQQIEAGLQQRAELLNLLLTDLYGPQRILKEGLLPPEIVYAHNGFLRPCMGFEPFGGRQLILYAANLARGPDGQVWVLGDRCQAPSGIGYALENRQVMTRILPELLGRFQVKRLAGYFRELRNALARLAPHGKDDPRVVILTPGPLNETYFEHAYLAAQLGYILVQGADLTMRDGRIWLKSLEGLQQVDVILRRVDDSFCDPLELRYESQLGVPGLLEAVRRRQVALANPVGSGLLENPALLAFLPTLAKYFLDQDLLLPSVATWWCGQPRERDFVLANLSQMVIKSTSRAGGERTIFGGMLDAAGQERLRQKILARPYLYVGQEQIKFSTAPSLGGGGIEQRNAVLRAFLVARQNDYLAMPGGLTRIASQVDGVSVSSQSGGASKDTWILQEQAEDQPPQLKTTVRLRSPSIRAMPLPSRAADNLYWVGRNIERAEMTVRLMRNLLLTLQEAVESPSPVYGQIVPQLLRALTHVTMSYPGFVGKGSGKRLKEPLAELLALAYDAEKEGSLTGTLRALRRSAYAVRDLWPSEAWRIVDDIEQMWLQVDLNPDPDSGVLLDQLERLLTGLLSFSGFAAESMCHDAGWRMFDTGRRLERSLLSVSLWRASLVLNFSEPDESQLLEAVLSTCASLTTYRRQYRSVLDLATALDLLLLDDQHPRSLVFQLKTLLEHIGELPRSREMAALKEDERLALEAYTGVRLADVTRLTTIAADAGIYSEFDTLLEETADQLCQLSEAITRIYFSHGQVHSMLVPLEDEA